MKKTRLLLIRLLLIGICFLLVFLTGCKSSIMTKVQPVNVSTIDENSALVTFVRPSSYGSAIQFGVWDSETFVGVVSGKSYVQYKATPGKHLFLARAENWSCVEADLEAGKSYFIVTAVRMGVWKARVALEPVTRAGNVSEEQINKWLTKLNATAVDPAQVESYVNQRIDHVRKAMENIHNGKAKCNTLSIEDFK